MNKKELDRELSEAVAERIEEVYQKGFDDGMRATEHMMKSLANNLIHAKAKKKEVKFLRTLLKNVQDLEVKMGKRLENIEGSIGNQIDKLDR